MDGRKEIYNNNITCVKKGEKYIYYSYYLWEEGRKEVHNATFIHGRKGGRMRRWKITILFYLC